MRASQISLTFLAALASAFVGGFVGGFGAGLTGNILLALLLLLPVALAAARLSGYWIARRESPPSKLELKVGCFLYVAVSALLGMAALPGAGLIIFIVSIGVAWVLHRAACKSLPQLAARTTD